MKATTLSNWESKLRSFLTKLPPKQVISQYSKGRLGFLDKLKKEIPSEIYIPPENLSRILWGIKFQSPIMNAAGMFKNGECYDMVARQGAGGYLGGTGTWNLREGNSKNGIKLPFVPYPNSHAASNWLGLPNEGDVVNYDRAINIRKIDGCPVGWSVMGSPDKEGEEKLEYLVKGMKLYYNAEVDFLEINESCPNTEEGSLKYGELVQRLKYIKENFLDERIRNIPVIVKFSNDTQLGQIPELLDLLIGLGYDGVNFGNTSTDYFKRRELIDEKEKKLYDFFVENFGGGVSGRPLKASSLELASSAVGYLKLRNPKQEFHVIRTGGIATFSDIADSEEAGISLNQWYTGYFENFSHCGHDIYKILFENATIYKKLFESSE